MQADFYAKKKKTPSQLKEGEKRRNDFKAKTKPVARRQPKRSIAY